MLWPCSGSLVSICPAVTSIGIFRVRINALPRALAVRGDRIYIGGDFNGVNGEPRTKLAAVDVADGALIDDFVPALDRGVRAIEVSRGRIYVGGGFTEIDGVARRKLARTGCGDRELVTSFTPTTNGVVYDIAVVRRPPLRGGRWPRRAGSRL